MANEKTIKLTKRTVDAIQSDGTDFYVFDSELIGFGVRVRLDVEFAQRFDVDNVVVHLKEFPDGE